MTNATRTLPDNYSQREEINLSAQKWLLILFNIVGLIAMGFTFIPLTFLGAVTHPNTPLIGKIYASNIGLVMIILCLFMLVIHEGIHGFFFWFYTRARPVFALKFSYAYTAAPDWYIPANQYTIVGLAPLVIIDLVCILMILLAPVTWVFPAIFVAALNTGGALGDLWIVFRLLRQPTGTLVQDKGKSVTYFTLQSKES